MFQVFDQQSPSQSSTALCKNKQIPKVMEKSVLKALSFYPELEDVHIRFVFKQNIRRSVMQAQPVPFSLLGKRKNRVYEIQISSLFKLTHSALPIHQLPDSVLIGWIGHELGHIMDYEQRSLIGIIRFGLGYVLSKKFIQHAEKTADTFAVNHQLGDYIIETKRFILDHADIPQAYKDRIARLYLSPDDIVEQVRELEETRSLP
ncbi:hypothetical protein [Olivibacter sp. XZL3]|uniref:hypothetical protein n=1 Tax=Olivibacter sp. XZL3 TaxID=1735116 RepID=UPI001064D895|nr:hypothetical protein [Olivibacter sp. XZL3]